MMLVKGLGLLGFVRGILIIKGFLNFFRSALRFFLLYNIAIGGIMKKILLLIVLIFVFFSCGTTPVKKTANRGPVRTFEHNGKLFYQMNSKIGFIHKPQSKLWHHKGEWYGILPGDIAKGHKGTHLVHIGKKASSVTVLQEVFPVTGVADVFPKGNSVFIVFDAYEGKQYTGKRSFAKLEYNAKNKSYDIESGFPMEIGSGSANEFIEGSTIAVDSNDVVWICNDISPGGETGHENDGSVEVIYSTSEDHKSFSKAKTIYKGAISDDIAKIVAWDNKIGVFISDQARWEFRFVWRDDSEALDLWPNNELVEQTEGNSDDHLNAAYDAKTATLYFGTKDSFDNLDLYKRDKSGVWSVTERFIRGSRPMIAFDSSGNQIFGFSYQSITKAKTSDLIFEDIFVGSWGQSKDMTSTQQPCDSSTGLVVAKKHAGKLQLLYLPLEGPANNFVDVVD